jgi:hypothetical protein
MKVGSTETKNHNSVRWTVAFFFAYVYVAMHGEWRQSPVVKG